jgi:hypothetical protein
VRLIDEIKSRAKGCLSSKNYPEAITLYTKAISICHDIPAQAILFANRSMCHLNMNNTNAATTDANEAVTLDPEYVKGYYRLGMAYIQANNYQLAKDALQKGLVKKSDDKELLQQLQRVEERIRSGSSSTTASLSSAPPRAMNSVKVAHSTSGKSVSSSSVPEPAPSRDTSRPMASSSSSSAAAEEDDEEDFELKGHIRGYKKTADGRVTTFFNRDVDENTKALIGNIAPKKLNAEGEVILTGNTTGSAWNAAGTYEEKTLTPWVSEYLTSKFSSLNIVIPAEQIDLSVRQSSSDIGSVLIETTATENVTGHAQVTMARGKTKHMCDFSLTVKWSLVVTYGDNNKSPNKIAGSISVIDITADKEYEIDNLQVTHLNDTATSLSGLPKDLAAVYNKYVKDTKVGLQKEIFSKLSDFWDELKTK